MAKMNKDDIIKAVEELSVLELNDLVKALEEKFGVSAMVGTGATISAGDGSATEADNVGTAPEQTTFNVVLAVTGDNKIGVIKAIREIVPTLGLVDAKTMAESAPKEVLVGVNKKTAEEAKARLEVAGAKVELK